MEAMLKARLRWPWWGRGKSFFTSGILASSTPITCIAKAKVYSVRKQEGFPAFRLEAIVIEENVANLSQIFGLEGTSVRVISFV